MEDICNGGGIRPLLQAKAQQESTFAEIGLKFERNLDLSQTQRQNRLIRSIQLRSLEHLA